MTDSQSDDALVEELAERAEKHVYADLAYNIAIEMLPILHAREAAAKDALDDALTEIKRLEHALAAAKADAERLASENASLISDIENLAGLLERADSEAWMDAVFIAAHPSKERAHQASETFHKWRDETRAALATYRENRNV